MKEQFFFILKTLVATFLVLLLLQVKLNGATIENQIRSGFHNSALLVPVQSVVGGAAKLAHEGWSSAVRFFRGQEQQMRGRLSKMKFERQSTAPEPTESDYQNEDLD